MFDCSCAYLPCVFVCHKLSCVCLCKCLLFVLYALCHMLTCAPLAKPTCSCVTHLFQLHSLCSTLFCLYAFFTSICCFLFPMFGITHFCHVIYVPALHLLCMCVCLYIYSLVFVFALIVAYAKLCLPVCAVCHKCLPACMSVFNAPPVSHLLAHLF